MRVHPLEHDFVFSVEIGLDFEGCKHYHMEDLIVVTDTGAHPLIDLPNDYLRVRD